MKPHVPYSIAGVVMSLALVAAIGCSQAVDPQVAQYRAKYLLADEPTEVTGVIDLREELTPEEGGDPVAPREVALVGLIGAVKEHWSDGHATFVLADPSLLADAHDDHAHDDHAHDDHAHGDHAHGHSHAHDHDHANCAFCKMHGPDFNALAVVQFTDESGKVLPIDARKLFGLADKQMVVVRGTARLDRDTNSLIVAANGLYIRQ